MKDFEKTISHQLRTNPTVHLATETTEIYSFKDWMEITSFLIYSLFISMVSSQEKKTMEINKNLINNIFLTRFSSNEIETDQQRL